MTIMTISNFVGKQKKKKLLKHQEWNNIEKLWLLHKLGVTLVDD